MKHYIDTTGTEFACYIEPSWRGMKRIQRKSRSAAKHSYRRRERTALKRSLATEVADELVTNAELGYLWKTAEQAIDEFDDLFEEVEWREEIGATDENYRFLVEALDAAHHRADDAFDEWFNAA